MFDETVCITSELCEVVFAHEVCIFFAKFENNG